MRSTCSVPSLTSSAMWSFYFGHSMSVCKSEGLRIITIGDEHPSGSGFKQKAI